ncbi:MAG TPA: phosphoenolpyruvate carboxykinase (ATP), partial [Gemmatimonadota bacterium]|nr:phosphoenolpyruvate carboxykinase (ATP) [Gemmatimonadota bacterium]
MTTKTIGLEALGLEPRRDVHHNLPAPALVEHAIRRGEGVLVRSGALATTTGARTGRSPDAKFTVDEPEIHDEIWWGDVNRPVSPETFERLQRKVADYLSDRELYVFDGFAGADPEYRLSVRVVNEKAWHNLFAHQLFLRPGRSERAAHEPEFTILHAPELEADPAKDGTGSTAFVLLSLTRGLILIGGTQYAGEIKKSIFSVMNWLMPRRGVLPMHCSANVGRDGDTALFFGLSGTGKTTLSADPERRLIGDDEHGWSNEGVFNFEGGCYAKCIRLSQEKEPEIWAAIRFGSVVENVVVDKGTRLVDYDDDSITENTRVAYPVDFIPGAMIPGIG